MTLDIFSGQSSMSGSFTGSFSGSITQAVTASYAATASAAAPTFVIGTDPGAAATASFRVGPAALFGAGILQKTGSVSVRIENSGDSAPVGATAQGIELIGNFAGDAYIQVYNRSTNAYGPFRYAASSHSFQQGPVVIGTDPGSFGGTDNLRVGGGLALGSADPRITQKRTDAAINEKSWDWLISLTTLEGRVVNDANSSANDWLLVTRSGSTVSSVALAGPTIIGTDPGGAQTLRIGGAVHAQNDVTIERTDNDTSVTIQRLGSAGAANLIGGLDFNGRNSTPASLAFARIRGFTTDPTAGNEQGRITFVIRKAGVETTLLSVDGGSFQISSNALVVGPDPGGTDIVRVGGDLRIQATGAIISTNAAGEPGRIRFDQGSPLAVEVVTTDNSAYSRFRAAELFATSASVAPLVIIGTDPSGSDAILRTQLNKTVLLAVGSKYLEIIADAGVADRGGILMSNTVAAGKMLKLNATFTAGAAASAHARLGFVTGTNVEAYIGAGALAAMEIGPLNTVGIGAAFSTTFQLNVAGSSSFQGSITVGTTALISSTTGSISHTAFGEAMAEVTWSTAAASGVKPNGTIWIQY